MIPGQKVSKYQGSRDDKLTQDGESALFYCLRSMFRNVVADFNSDEPMRFVDAFLFLSNDTYWFELGGLDRGHFWKLLTKADE